MKRALCLSLLVPFALLACEDAVVTSTPPPPPNRRPLPVASASASASATAASAPPLTEADFSRSDANRDPFFAYYEVAVPPPPPAGTRPPVLAESFALDELKLVGIVTGGTSRAMFTDPEGKGWIVNVGQLVGRAEVVKGSSTNKGASAEYELNWKVDRIRDNDVVFVRETPGRSNVPSATRVVTLRTEEERNSRRR